MFSVILAAGSATRMRPLSFYIPKILLPVRGRPVLDHILDNLEGLDIKQHYVVASNYLEVLERYVQEARIDNVVPVRGLGWETGGDLALALEQIGREEDAVIVNGDIITDLKMTQVFDFHQDTGGLATMAVFRLENDVESRRFGRVVLDRDSRIVSFEEKPSSAQAGEPLVNSGFYIFDRKLVENRRRFLVPRRFRLELDLFPRLAREGYLYGNRANLGYWWDVGTLESYLKAEEFLVSKPGIIPPD